VREVRVARGVLDEVLAQHRAGVDGGHERCGALLGRVQGDVVEVEALHPVRNEHPHPARAFSIPAEDALAAAAAARARGCEVVGTWHAHPRGRADLSPADARGLADASAAPGEGGDASRRPHAFLVSGRGAGRATVLAAWAGTPPRRVGLVRAR
jgi:proteasome lid subunit RPN8/RPN11